MSTQSLTVTETKTDLVESLSLATGTDYAVQNASNAVIFLAEAASADDVDNGFLINPSAQMVIQPPISGSIFVWTSSGNALLIVGEV